MAVLSSFYNDPSFLNSIYSLNISLEQYYANRILNGDGSRIIWASNQYSFFRRAQLNNSSGNNDLNLPYINYWLKDIQPQTTSRWTLPGQAQGLFVDEIQSAIRVNPWGLGYEATYFANRQDDTLYAFQRLAYDSTIKTTVDYTIAVNDQNGNPVNLLFRGVIHLTGLVYNPQYMEQEWLERNKIFSIAMDFTVDTFLVYGNQDVAIPLEVIFTFNSLHGDGNSISEVEQKNAVVDYFNKDVGF